MSGSISWKCWILVLSGTHTVHGLVQWSWSRKRMAAWGFCMDLRKLNNWTIKDTYLLPHIDETLDSLQGSQWFSSLNLKSGYWLVKMDEESKPLTAFTVGLLGFYECKRMPFRLTNAPTIFQQLMGDLSSGPQSPLVYHLPRWYSHLLQGSSQPPWGDRGCVSEIGGGWTQTQAF